MAGALFNVPERAGKSADSSIAKKVNSKTTKTSTAVRGGGGVVERINTARALIEKNLGQYIDDYATIQEEISLSVYITSAIQNGIISIDTETTGLDPILDTIVGFSIYTPGQKAAYVPLNHKSYITGIKSDGQLSIEFAMSELERLRESGTKIVMFNASFDIRVIRNQLGVRLKCYWDCYLAARLLNENEGPGNNNLKYLHHKYCVKDESSASRFNDLFEGISFDLVPIKLGYLYAARDALITYELFEFQKPFLTVDNQECIDRELQDVSWVFFNIEMPCVEVVADMEDRGVTFDTKLAYELHEIYHKKLSDKLQEVYATINMYSDEIESYRAKNPNNKLSDPINIDSPTQIAILLYDIMNVGVIDDKAPRGTGEKILIKIDNAFTKSLLEYRGIEKLISTYIDKLPSCVNKQDGRIHCKFNQYGADTGRFSSNDPNLQNIPSKNHDIRKMFIATQEEKIVNFDTDDFLEVDKFTEIFTNDEWVPVSKFCIGDTVDICGELFTISNIEEGNGKVRIYL